MTNPPQVRLDLQRVGRIGIGEAVLSDAKTVDQLVAVLAQADGAGASMLMTRLREDQFEALPDVWRRRLDYEPLSRTAFFGLPATPRDTQEVVVVTGGTADVAAAREAVRTLEFHGFVATEIYDIGVAGLWRLQEQVPAIGAHTVVIAVAGMDAALPTVLSGLVSSVVIAVPSSVGYGVAQGGATALRSLLSSCAPGLVVVNIDNGYGAACAAMRVLQ